MGSTATAFPNISTQFKGGERLGKPKPAIGKRRARRLKKEVEVIAAVYGTPPDYTGTDRQWLRDVRDGKLHPTPIQMAAGATLVRREDGDAPGGGKTLEQLIAASTPEQHVVRAADLIDGARRTLADYPGRLIEVDPPASSEPPPSPTPDSALQAEIARLEADRAELRAAIERHERERAAEDRNRQERMLRNGRDYVPFGRRL